MIRITTDQINKLINSALFICALCFSSLIFSQPDTKTANILFEPKTIPQSDDQALPLISFATNSDQQPSQPVSGQNQSLEERRNIQEAIADYVTAIGDEESEEGPYSVQLPENLMAAGQLAQQIQDHDTALDFFNRAQSVIRINEGLETLTQIPIMQAIVESHYALEQLKEADKVQDNILSLIQQNYGQRSLDTIPARYEYGVWHLNAFLERSNILLNVNRMNVAQFMQDPMNFVHDQNNLRDTPLFNLYQAQQNFLHSIDILVSNQQYFHPQILDLEKMLLTSYFLSIHRENILYEPDFYLTRKKRKTGSRLNTNAIELMESEEYQQGNASHQRSITYISNNPEKNHAMLANAMLEAADWHLLFERKVKAAKDYQSVYDYFIDQPEILNEVSAQLYPEFPVILPTYLPPPNSRDKLEISADDNVDYFGYFDVSFRIDKYGKAKKIRILSQQGEITRNMEIRMKQYLQKVLFRPLFKDGKPFTETVSLRYYLGR